MKKIGVAGCGFVGKAMINGFKETHIVKCYDIVPERSSNSLEEVLSCDFVFVCLPTPMYEESGKCNTSYISDFFDTAIPKCDESGHFPTFILKSTIPVGTTSELNKKHNLDGKIVHSPEFLSAKTASEDFINSPRFIVGGTGDSAYQTMNLYEERFPSVNCHLMSSEESEFVKLFCNSFYATKVLFMNEMKLFSDHLGLNWESILEGFLTQGWVSSMHTQVPGHDGKLGFGGACFPKDINSMAYQISKDHGLDSSLLDTIIKRNEEIRGDNDA